MTAGSRLYRAAAHSIAPILRAPCVRTVYIRRSVAAGDASFPWSDLDLGLVVDECGGRQMNALRRRFQAARAAFPRLGECQIASAGELAELALSDPYRASLDRRFAITVAGDSPSIPRVPVSPRAAARRLVYWFERYLPDAVRQGNLRNQRKFVLEMWNALGVIEGKWAEPLATRMETADRARAAGFIEAEADDSLFALCCRIATRAQRQLFPPAPPVSQTILLTGPNPLVILRDESTPWPALALSQDNIVATAPVLQLLLETQSPFLWLSHGLALKDLGFAPPSRGAWADACLRHTGGERLRIPGFMSKVNPIAMLNTVERVLDVLERGELPEGPPSGHPSAEADPSVASYYRDRFDTVLEAAARLRQRAVQIASLADEVHARVARNGY